MAIQLVGDGPAIETAASVLADTDIPVERGTHADLASAPAGIVSGVSGSGVFEQIQTETTYWLAVEIGGLGGIPISDIDAAVVGFGPESGCYQCLRRRVLANEPSRSAQPSGSRHAAHLAGATAGYELIELLTGTDRITGNVLEVPGPRRRFLPTPGCSCQEPPAQALSISFDGHDLETAVETAETAIDPRVGIITEVGEAESFPVPYYLAQLAGTDEFSDVTAPAQAAGVAVDWNVAFMKAVGEAFERYAAGTYRIDQLKRAPIETLEEAVSPSRFAAGPETVPEDPRLWERGYRLGTDTAVWLPAAAVRFPQPESSPLPAITTGLAAASSLGDAIYRGLMEVIERDAAMIDWYSTGTQPAVTTTDSTIETLRRRAASEGLSVTLRVVTQDLPIPVIAAILTRDQWPRVAVAAAADLDGTAAARSALTEALQNWMELRRMGPDTAAEQSGAIAHYADRPPEIEWFLETDGTIEAAALGDVQSTPSNPQLETIFDQLTARDLTAYATRLTTTDLEALGFEVVRVLVPGAQPLFVDTPVFGERSETVPGTQDNTPNRDRPHHPYP